MSPISPTNPTTSEPAKPPAWAQKLALRAAQMESIVIRRLLVVGALGVMVMIGLFLSNYSSERAHDYWCAMFPIFGIACLAHEIASGRAYEVALWRLVLRQALHWIGPIVAVKILFMQHARGQMSTDAVALTVILVLATTCFLAGVHFDRSFYWVSALLVFAALIGTEIETYLWLVVVLTAIAAALVVLSAILLRHGRRPGAGEGPTPENA